MKRPLIKLNPLTRRMLMRFRSIKRGYVSFLLLSFLILLSVLGPFLVGNRALVVKYDGDFSFPVIGRFHTGADFGESYVYEADYRSLKKKFQREGQGNWVLMPPVPFSGTEVVEIVEPLLLKDGKYQSPHTGKLILDGKAFTLHENGRRNRVWTVKNGWLHGSMRGYDDNGDLVEKGRWDRGGRVAYESLTPELPPEWTGDSELASLLYQVTFPSRPGIGGHLLGTDESGRDVLARLYEGFRIVVLASLIYILLTYSFGIAIGCAMGYFGGTFDLIMQRFIEIWQSVPFLYIVIILAAVITPNLFTLMLIIIAFSWMGLTYYMRTATYREKEREYVQAARLLGASNTRIVFRHILPNTLSIIITFIPFSVSGLIGALTALDFLGFGLPPTEPTWGEMLKQGTEHYERPWILLTIFFSLVLVLVLVTFIGEAIRQAFDPKKFTVYK